MTADFIPPARSALSRRAWLRQAATGAAAMCLAARLGGFALLAEEPHIAEHPRGRISDEDEIALGRRFAADYEQEVPILSNGMIDRHLNATVQELAAKSRRPGLPYRVKLINTAAVNASSLPGGSIYVNRGLMDLMTSEDELAAILAHEIAHIAGRHAINQIMLTFQARALLKPVLDNLNKRNGVVDKIITQLGGAVAMLARLEFSRQDEQQADLLSLYNMLRAGWDPRGLVKILTALEGLESGQSDAVMLASPVLSGHPPAAERLAVVQRELTVVSIPEDARTDSFDFRACKAAMQLLPPPAKAAQE